MELPKSWGLKTKKRSDGKLDIIGKTDAGEEYRVRTTDGSEVTQTDISELKDADRESYRNREDGARKFVSKITDYAAKQKQSRDSEFQDELNEVAERIVGECTQDGMATSPGMIDMPLSVGLTSSYARGERYWKWHKQHFGES